MAKEGSRQSPRTTYGKGRRTGVEVPTKNSGTEEVEDFFNKARSPSRTRKENKKPRFSLSSNASEGHRSSPRSVSRKAQNVQRRTKGRASDVSSVATAPTAVETTRQAQRSPEDEEIAPIQENDFPEAEDPQEEEEEDDVPPRPPSPSPDSESDVDMQLPETQQDFPVDDDDVDEEEEDNEGTGYNMATPQTTDSEKQKREEKARKKNKKKKKEKKRKSVQMEEPKPRKKAKKKGGYFPSEGIQTGPRDFDELTIVEPEPEEGVRRSKRSRMKPLEYWKNERYHYGPNDFDEDEFVGVKNMPVPVKIIRAGPTPRKPRVATLIPTSHQSKKSKEVRVEPFDSSTLRKSGMTYMDGQEGEVFDATLDEVHDMKCVAYHDLMDERKLSVSEHRTKKEGKVVGRAGQTFHIENAAPFPGYIAGNIVLPPKGIKDSESSGTCTQIFTCVDGQAGAIEVAYGLPDDGGILDPKTAQRFLVGPRDMFRVPPGNTYRLCNHSKTQETYLSWVIIRSIEEDED